MKEITYYPHPTDNMWNSEVETLIPWLSGRGVDIGSSNRSIFPGVVRVDFDESRDPDILASGDNLPFNDGQFDYLYSVHSFEHFDDQIKLLDEWARVVKKGGIIAIVHPDVEFTGVQKPIEQNMDKNPFNKHFHERTRDEFIKWFESLGRIDLKIIDSGIACGHWSFYIILQHV